MSKATKYASDALMFDLEDAVAIGAKAEARALVADAIDEHRQWPGALFVRLNGWKTGFLLADLLAVVRPGLVGVALPKIDEPAEIVALDLVLGDLERAHGLPVGDIEILPILETPRALYRVFEICECSARVRRVTGVGGSDIVGGDLTRSLGLPANESAITEMLHLNSRGILEARAAGVREILNGSTSDLADLDKARAVALQAKRMAATGTLVIHPSHVPIVNEVFSPSDREIADARAVVEAMRRAIDDDGAASTTHDGRMLDYAHVRSSLELLERARSLGLDIGGTMPTIDVH
jgi:citrate lyase subunit beta/citryl-CoA lyase